MADIFQEVEEGLRQDRVRVLLRKYGPIVISAIAVLLTVVAVRAAWVAIQKNAALRSSDAFSAAQELFEDGQIDEAMAAFAALSEDGARGYGVMAGMQEAAAAVEAGSIEEGARLYDEAARRTRDPLLKGAAQLKAAYLLADRIDLDALEERLEPLRERGAPFELAADELFGAAALAAGDYARAREAYSYLTISLEAPGGVQRRAQEALAVIDAAEAASQTDDDE